MDNDDATIVFFFKCIPFLHCPLYPSSAPSLPPINAPWRSPHP